MLVLLNSNDALVMYARLFFSSLFYFIFLFILTAEGDLASFSTDHKTNHFKSQQNASTAATESTQVVSVSHHLCAIF